MRIPKLIYSTNRPSIGKINRVIPLAKFESRDGKGMQEAEETLDQPFPSAISD